MTKIRTTKDDGQLIETKKQCTIRHIIQFENSSKSIFKIKQSDIIKSLYSEGRDDISPSTITPLLAAIQEYVLQLSKS